MKGKGNYYKYKTKKFFEKEGYICEYLERLQRIYKNGKVIYIKKDTFGADIIAMNENEICFIQSKLGKKNIDKGIKEFQKYPYPKFVRRILVVWEKKKREPEIIEWETINRRSK